MIFDKAILRTYAQLASPNNLPPNVYFSHTDHAITIFDAYPKAVFHFLVLPRIKHKDKEGPLSATNLTSLKKFLNSKETTKEDIKTLLRQFKEDGEKVHEMIVEEMRDRFGFVWNVNLGFHAVQSMDHIHLHVMSEDLCAPGLKTKKHYNSFHPKLGFFLHLNDVLSWFEDGKAESYTRSMTKLDEAFYEKKLKEPLECFHCGKEQKNVPTLKAHLQGHFDKMAAAKRKVTETEANKKRKFNDDQTEENRSRDLDLKQETEKRSLVSESAFEAPSQIEGSETSASPKKQRSA